VQLKKRDGAKRELLSSVLGLRASGAPSAADVEKELTQRHRRPLFIHGVISISRFHTLCSAAPYDTPNRNKRDDAVESHGGRHKAKSEV
jgi:hypothetical protein